MTNWSLIESPPRAGAWNMAVDEALLYTTVEDPTQGALRLYSWNPACCSIGRYRARRPRAQHARDRASCGRGEARALLRAGAHVLPHRSHRRATRLRRRAGKLSQNIVRARCGSGATGRRGRDHRRGRPRQMRSNPRASTTLGEILYGGRKLVGSAQYRHGGPPATRLHPPDDPSERFFTGLNLDPESMQAALEQGRARLATLTEALGRAVELEEVASAVAAGFANAWGVDLVPRSLTPAETARAAKLERDKYRSESWNCLR
ncbi:MAG: hypothetical protein WKH64_00630 [Chloroflexia bacterium]